MITTPNDFCQECTDLLNESALDTSAKRIRFFNRAMRAIKDVRKWSWNRVSGTLTMVVDTTEYDLTTAFSNYDPMWGIFEVYLGGEKIEPVDYTRKDDTTADKYYLKPDNKTIGFTFEVTGSENVVIWYTPSHTAATTAATTLVPSVPDSMLGPVALLMKSYVHGGKRQRVDQKNTLLEYKEAIGEAILKDASHKVKDAPHNIPTVFTYGRVKRTYRF